MSIDRVFRPVNGQLLAPLRDIPYGRSNLGRAGCEAIASYNLLLLIGRPEPLEDVVAFYTELFRSSALAGFGMQGLWGAATWDIRRFLASRGVPYRSAGTLRGLEALCDAPCAVILSYWNKPITTGYHTVAIRYDGERFTAYNQNCSSPVPAEADSLRAFLPGRGRFIRGFCVKPA